MEGPSGELWTQRGRQQPERRRNRVEEEAGAAEAEDLCAGCEAAGEQTGDADWVGADWGGWGRAEGAGGGG